MSIAVIGGKLNRNNPQNMNRFHRYGKYLVSLIITLVTNTSRGNTVFYDGVKHTYLGKRAHVLKHLHGRIVMGPFERWFHGGFLCRVHRTVIFLIFTKQSFLHFIHYEYWFYNLYISSTMSTKYIYDSGMGLKPKQFLKSHNRENVSVLN